jgi:hypothetical protein
MGWVCKTGRTYAVLMCCHDGDPATYRVDAIDLKVIILIPNDDDHDRWRRVPTGEGLTLAASFPSQPMAVIT